mmetsp:Transcript_61739/g.163593  ORF Transcript_61739/g.163593 Transcript_61739/m.163593 type:complete len:520 (-) Transcript_61739:170-1729(-)
MLHLIRDYILSAADQSSLELAQVWLRSPCGPMLTPLVSELLNHLLMLPSVHSHSQSRSYLQLLHCLMDMQSSSIPPNAFVRLLHISLNVPAVQRHLVRELIRIQLNFGLAIVHLELQQALDLAHRMLNIHHERILLSLSPADLALLAWVPRDAFRSLADDFPFAMLSENENSSVEQQHHTVKEPVDAFCCLVMLHSLLALRMVDVLAWLHNGAVGFLVVSLCSESINVRRIGYQAIGAFFNAISIHSGFAEKRHILRMLSCLRDAVTELNQRLSGIITCFVAQGLRVLMQPAHAQYRKVNRFILSRPHFDLLEAPLFFSHFHCVSTQQPRADRLWLLALLHAGMHSNLDFQMCSTRRLLPLLVSCHDAHLSDLPTRRSCISLLCRCSRIPIAAAQMLGVCGIPHWICKRASYGRVTDLDDELGLLLSLVSSPAMGTLTQLQIEQCSLAAIALWRAGGGRSNQVNYETKVAEEEFGWPMTPTNTARLHVFLKITDKIGDAAWSTLPPKMSVDIVAAASQP